MESEEKDLLIKIYEKVEKMDEELRTEMQEGLKEVREEMQTGLKEVREEVQEVREEMQTELKVVRSEIQDVSRKLQNETQRISKELQNETQRISKELRRMNGNIAKIEAEQGDKINILFDTFEMHDENISQNTKRIEKLKKRIVKNEDEIFVINQKIQNI